MSKHTPGPWRLSSHGQIGPINGGTLVAECLFKSCGETLPMEANARLIAAAPELLEQVKQALKFCRNEGIDPTWECALEKVIAKAEGGAE